MAKMTDLPVRKVEAAPTLSLWDWFETPDFGRFFDVRPFFGRFDRLMRLEQELKDDTLVVRAEIPGIDPEKDVEITVQDGMLHIKAERRSESKETTEGSFRSEFHYGSFERYIRVPKETDMDDVKATYKDGILEVTCPYKVPTEKMLKKVEVSRS
ncbi:MAG TPA: Hsp20/alpha crystallin family protein [Acidimicrobiales bacterium]|nr:Hsp20/alpha crystallin family protein [Acidimicrobiales bacterium]HTN81855.1 Hsp20/alpha crystallin family protein [Acidimicrobiales bacterium]